MNVAKRIVYIPMLERLGQSKEKTDCVLKAVVYKFAGGDLQAGNKICFSGR